MISKSMACCPIWVQLIIFFELYMVLSILIIFIDVMFHPKIAKSFGWPVKNYLFLTKSFSGREHYIYMNVYNFLQERCVKKNDVHKRVTLIKKFRRDLFDIINSIDISKAKDNARFNLDTWLITKSDLKKMDMIGISYREIRKTTIFIKLIHFRVTGCWPQRKYKFYRLTFNKRVIEKFKEVF